MTDTAPGAKPTLRDLDAQLEPYRHTSALRSWWQLGSTLLLFIASWIAMYWSLSISYWLTLLLSVPTSLFVVRLFIFQHDCGHRSFFNSKKLNDFCGSLLGLITLTPYHAWRREHASHHATSGDLDRRGRSGEIWTMTLEEYRLATWRERLRYRLYRNPFILFVVGPLYHFAFYQRFPSRQPRTWKKERRSVHLTNLGLVIIVVALSWLIGPWNFLLVQGPVTVLTASVGVWMFYMQHQFEDAYWESNGEWDYVDAAVCGSSHYRLPRILQWFTGNIGFHHIHHLDPRIPNYHLQACHDNNPEFHQVREFSLFDSLSCLNARLWDEENKKMVGFAAAGESCHGSILATASNSEVKLSPPSQPAT